MLVGLRCLTLGFGFTGITLTAPFMLCVTAMVTSMS